jgi:hypothetical protein
MLEFCVRAFLAEYFLPSMGRDTDALDNLAVLCSRIVSFPVPARQVAAGSDMR